MFLLCDHQLSHQQCKVEPRTISTVRHLVRLDDDSGGASAEDLLSAFPVSIVDVLSWDMRGHQVTTWDDGGKNRPVLKLLFLAKPQQV